MNDRKIEGYCCEKHNNELIEARERSRLVGSFMAPEEIGCINRITSHLAELRDSAASVASPK